MKQPETCLACGLLERPCIECKQHDWALPSTPPVENSKAVGGPSAADGQGVCARVKYQIDVLFSVRGVLEQRTYFRTKPRDVGRLCGLATSSGATCILLTLVHS